MDHLLLHVTWSWNFLLVISIFVLISLFRWCSSAEVRKEHRLRLLLRGTPTRSHLGRKWVLNTPCNCKNTVFKSTWLTKWPPPLKIHFLKTPGWPSPCSLDTGRAGDLGLGQKLVLPRCSTCQWKHFKRFFFEDCVFDVIMISFCKWFKEGVRYDCYTDAHSSITASRD